MLRSLHGRMSVASIRPYGSSVTKISLRFSRPNRDEVEGKMMLVGHDQADGRDFRSRVEDGPAHGVERVLNGLTVMLGKGLEQRLTNGVPPAGRSPRRHPHTSTSP